MSNPSKPPLDGPHKGEIKVSSKTLAHISRGLYRSTAGALKELVSNAYDADADEVVISTNPPAFGSVTCRDNGSGWTIAEFRELMEGRIGDSAKRLDSDLTPQHSRPIIGRIGIGLMAVAQICHEFEVWSHHRASETAFHGVVTIRDTLEQELDGTPPPEDRQLPVGQYRCEPVPFSQEEAGTTIVVTDVKRGFTLKHQHTARGQEEHGRVASGTPRNFRAFLKECYRQRSVTALGDYWELLWGLAVQCPVPYLRGGPVDRYAVQGDVDEVGAFLQQKLPQSLNLRVDQVCVCKPLLLPNTGTGGEPVPCSVHFFQIDEDVYGSRLRAHGYFLAQARAVRPSELRGVLIRVRGVGIGTYDKSFLDYSEWAAGPRLQQVTGEIYVEEGLEDALNIDRDSFNEMHPHYLHLQRCLHNSLTGIFKSLTADSKNRSSAEAERRSARTRQRLTARIRDISGIAFRIRPAPASQDALVEVDIDTQQVLAKRQVGWTRSARRSETAVNVAIAAAVADALHPDEGSSAQRFAVLMELLREVL